MSKLAHPILFILLPFGRLWLWARSGNLQEGDDAPEFALRSLEGGPVTALSSFRGSKPVVLVFGSYT